MAIKTSVSVVIPMRNEEKYIEACLKSILVNDYPGELLEILVIDGMSTDKSREIVKKMVVDYSNIRLLENPERITPAALNYGIESAEGEIIVRMDVHTEYPRDYISRCVENLHKFSADNVGGLWDIQASCDRPLPKAIALTQAHPVGVGNIAYRLGSDKPQWVDTVPYGCYWRKKLIELGGFDTDLIRNQDDELNARLIKSGGKILLDPSIKCVYYTRSKLSQVWCMFFQYGYFKPLAAYKLGRIYTLRQLAPPAFVVGVMFLVVSSILSSIFALLFVLFIGLYASVLIGAALMELIKTSRFRVAVWMPVAFATMHFSYGLGFLKGIVDFFLLKKRPKDAVITR